MVISKAESAKRYRAKHPERSKAANRAAHAKYKAQPRTPEQIAKKREAGWRQQGINITFAEYTKLYESQNGQCACCGDPEPVLHVDHNHYTGEVRGLLCSDCNTGIGLLGDTLDAARAAVAYLERVASS